MTIEHGSVVAIEEEPLGDELAKDYAAGASVIEVRDLSDFPEFGGSVALVGETVAYDRVDEDANTILLSAPTALDHSAEEPVLMDPPVKRYVAHVQIDDVAGEVVLADLSHPLKMYLPLGSRDPGAEESVVISNETGVWEVVDVLGVLPGLVGGSLDIPDTDLPGAHIDGDGNAAFGGTSATNGPVTIGADGAVVFRSVVIAPLDGSAVPLVIFDDLSTGGNWTEWRTAASSTLARVTNIGEIDTQFGFRVYSGGWGAGADLALLASQIRFGFSGLDTDLVRTDAGELTLSKSATGVDGAFLWGGGSGNGYSRLDGADYIQLAKKNADPPTPPAGDVRVYCKVVAGTSKLFAIDDAGGVHGLW